MHPRVYRRHAPAKVNLALEVLGIREDGFHELRTIFDALEFGDELQFFPQEGGEFSLSLEGSEVEGIPLDESNLILRAARAYREAFPGTLGGRFLLKKRIPMGAGLGGGSSDGAQALRLLEEAELGEGRLRERRAPQVLEEIARGLGADLPFFLRGGRAFADGRGDRIHSLERQAPLYYILLLNRVHCDTGAVFRRYQGDLTIPGPFLGSIPGRQERQKASKANHLSHQSSSRLTAEAFSRSFGQGSSGFFSGFFSEENAENVPTNPSFALDPSRPSPFLCSVEKAEAYLDWVLHVDAPAEPLAWLFNDLRNPAIQEYPLLEEIPRLLEVLDLPSPHLSGSGSTFFLVFQEKEARDSMAEGLRGELEKGSPAKKKFISIVTTRSL